MKRLPNSPNFSDPTVGRARLKRVQGAALIIVLAFVVLLTGVIIAFFSRSLLDRQISDSSANQTKAEIFADGAVETIIGDLQQEIAAGSNPVVVTIGSSGSSTTIYYPSAPASMVPCLSGSSPNGPTPANVVKRSAFNSPFFTGTNYSANSSIYPASDRAANVSTTLPSLNGRTLTLGRWNKPLFVSSTSADYTPIQSGSETFTAPDWIFQARDGSNPKTFSNDFKVSGTNPIVGRYAYVVYDEGGLLDVNVAGFPKDGVTPKDAASRTAVSYADLTQIGLTKSQIDALVGWRNYASADAQGSFPNYTFTTGTSFMSAVLSNTNGFLLAGNSTLNNGQSDRLFTSRQELIRFFLQGVSQNDQASSQQLENSLQYLTTFSRSLDQPSYVPAVQVDPSAPVVLAPSLGGNTAYGGDKLINPSFLNVRVKTAFTRNDGSTANVGDPLINKRFALQRLAWVTYAGPSQMRNQSDPDIQALISNGVSWSYLQLGTAENIQKYFGLTWDRGNNRWIYNVHNGGGKGTGAIALIGRPVNNLSAPGDFVEDARREPDFFELLKAGIAVGSLGKVAANSNNSVSGAIVPLGYQAQEVPVNLRYRLDSSVDYHVIQIGANILSEVNPTSYPVRISYDDGTGPLEFQGVTDLPYLAYIFNGVLRQTMPTPPQNNYGGPSPIQCPLAQAGNLTDPGKAYVIQVPAVWNPYDPNGTAGVKRPTRFRVTVDSSDPITGLSHNIWFAAEATQMTANGGYGNDGIYAPNRIYSYDPQQNNTRPTATSPVSDNVTFDDSNGSLYREPTLIFNPAIGHASRTGAIGNITAATVDVGYDNVNSLPGESDRSHGPWAPLVLGSVPLAFTSGSMIYYTALPVLGVGNNRDPDRYVYFTYRLQYQDEHGTWVTYDTKYGRTTEGVVSFNIRGNVSPCIIKGPDWYNPYSWAAAIDPRTARFGLVMDTKNEGRSRSGGDPPGSSAPPLYGWIFDSNGGFSAANLITYPIRPDFTAGLDFLDTTASVNRVNRVNFANNVAILGQASMWDVPFPSFGAGWTEPIINDLPEGHIGGQCNVPKFAPGMYAQNNTSVPYYPKHLYTENKPNADVQPAYYADADGVVRRAAGAYVSANTGSPGASANSPIGLPTATIQGYSGEPKTLVTPATPAKNPTFSQSQSRPLMLHRPFRTVAELGYVFRDLPWKNLDFFTPESADAGLLDLFCINETSDSQGMVAGKVNLNTAPGPVLAAIVSGAYIDDPKVSDATVGSLTPTLAQDIANALNARVKDPNYGPLQNISELVGKWNSRAPISPGIKYTLSYPPANAGMDLPSSSGYCDGKLSYTGFSGASSTSSNTAVNLTDALANSSIPSQLKTSMTQIQRFRESPIRALSTVGQTRTWNLMIDLVAQIGRYPQSAKSLAQFTVEGEQRYWVHLAIDRLTGKIIDEQVEVVKE